MPSTRNIIIFAAIAGILVLAYFVFLRPGATPEANLVTTTPTTTSTTLPSGTVASVTNANQLTPNDFLALLLSVKNIKLNDAIFADPAFSTLHDSSITLVPDATTGRPNPFAQFGTDIVVPTSTPITGPSSVTPTTAPTNPTTPTTNPKTPTTPTNPATTTPVKP